MHKTSTHYEQLNVARDASPEQIKRAYRKLAQQLHPDRNPAANASELMSRVNASHEVLGNPVRRAAYDAQLAASERYQREARQRQNAESSAQARQGAAAYAAAAAATARPASPPPPPSSPPPRAAKARPSARPDKARTVSKRRRRRALVRWVLLFMTFCAAGAWMGYDHNAGLSYTPTDALPVQTRVKPVPTLAETAAAALPPVPVEPECVVPTHDPLGAPWPSEAAYVQGMPMLKKSGWSQIVIDNTAGDSAVYAKVTDAVGRNAYRHAYVPAGGQFSFSRMDAGYYLLKYQMIKTGCAFASSRILLEEMPVGSQVKSSVYKLTLQKLNNRAAAPGRLKPDQF